MIQYSSQPLLFTFISLTCGKSHGKGRTKREISRCDIKLKEKNLKFMNSHEHRQPQQQRHISVDNFLIIEFHYISCERSDVDDRINFISFLCQHSAFHFMPLSECFYQLLFLRITKTSDFYGLLKYFQKTLNCNGKERTFLNFLTTTKLIKVDFF